MSTIAHKRGRDGRVKALKHSPELDRSHPGRPRTKSKTTADRAPVVRASVVGGTSRVVFGATFPGGPPLITHQVDLAEYDPANDLRLLSDVLDLADRGQLNLLREVLGVDSEAGAYRAIASLAVRASFVAHAALDEWGGRARAAEIAAEQTRVDRIENQLSQLGEQVAALAAPKVRTVERDAEGRISKIHEVPA
jgi:hypothetical protein